MDKTVELLTKILSGSEDPEVTALSEAIKARHGITMPLEKPVTLSPGVETLVRDVKTCRGIRSTHIASCPSPFHPRVRTIPACFVTETPTEDLAGFGLSALAPRAIANPQPPYSTAHLTHAFGDKLICRIATEKGCENP